MVTKLNLREFWDDYEDDVQDNRPEFIEEGEARVKYRRSEKIRR